MIIYVVMIAMSIAFSYLSTKTHNRINKIILYILASVPFFIISAIRYDVGTDYNYRYVPDFNKILKGIEISNLEIGFELIIKLCLLFSENSQLLFVITSGIITFFIMNTIFSTSKNCYISVLLFFIGGFFFQSLNMIRQFISMSIIFFCYRYLLERKRYPFYLLGILIAFFIHSSSIIMLILLVLKKRLYIRPIIVFPILVIILILGTNLMNIISPIIQNTRFNVYLVGLYAKGDISYLGLVVNIIIYICLYRLYKIKERNIQISSEDKLFINIQGLALIFMTMSSVHILFSRIAYFFIIFQILSIPYFVETTRILEIHIGEKWTKVMIYGCIILCFLVAFSYTNIINNDNEPLPYKTIFNKGKEYR